MDDLGVFFLHHETGPRTANNLALIRHFNPGVPIVPISQWGETLPGGYNARDLRRGAWRQYPPKWFDRHDWKAFPRRLIKGLKRSFYWRNADLPIYQWRTAQASAMAKRWVVLEWDVFCNVDLRAFYKGVWDADIAGRRIHNDPLENWQWFSLEEKNRVPVKARDHICGISVLAGIFISDEALCKMSHAIRVDPGWRDVFCEVRIGTVAKSLGFNPVEISSYARETITDQLFKAHEIKRPGVWHHVKDHDPMVALS